MTDYYELLGIPANASQPTIQQALNTYRTTLQESLNDPRQMRAASKALNDIVPAIEQNLLTSTEARAAYDQRLEEAKHPKAPQELADDEGLDDEVPHPFFFDPFDGYDTETPALTLRQIGTKLDTEWATTVGWIKNTSQDTHVLVGYLTFAADRHRLAARIEKIIEAVSGIQGPAMDVNEGIERCIDILDPDIERPRVGFQGPYFNGKAYVFDIGEFLPDRVAPVEFVLFHDGTRGCVFGTTQTTVPWVKFPDGTRRTRFALMPVDTDPAIGVTEKTIKLLFHMEQLKPYADYTTSIIVSLENFNPPVEIPLHIHFRLQARPPRVVFEPNPVAGSPLQVGTHKRGETISTNIRAKNTGDEEHTPLVAYIAAPDPATKAKPARFHANETITLTINTSKFPTGERFLVTFPIDYSSIPGASGLPSISVEGYIYPTVWQSIARKRGLGARTGIGLVTALIGSFLFMTLAANVAGTASLWWLFILSVPALCAGIAYFVATTISKHAKAAQNSNVLQRVRSPLWQWRLAGAYGLIVAILCSLLPATPFALWISGITGGVVGLLGGFIIDGDS
jgi:hypothetical protein